MDSLTEIISKNRAGYCLECGKCSAVCPITRWGAYTYASPRLLVEKVILGQGEDIFNDDLFWFCLTCNRCSEICPSNVNFPEFIRDLRKLGRVNTRSGVCTHTGVIQTWGKMMAQPDVHQNRLTWLTSDLKVSDDSDTVYFVGCLPYFDVMFKDIGFEGVKIAQAALKIMNHLGIQPQILADERCCGHDQIWQGDFDAFTALASLNLEQFKKSGANRIITTCPECALTLQVDYPRYVHNHNLEVLHIAELLAHSDITLASYKHTDSKTDDKLHEPLITYHDPCRLGRHLGVYDSPRKILADMDFRITEMEHNRHTSLCCGTSCWTSCGSASKNIQVERLREAKATGAELLVTTCLKCQIHFKCAQNVPNAMEKTNIEINDLSTLVADRLS